MIERHFGVHGEPGGGAHSGRLGHVRAGKFVKVMPRDYGRMLQAFARVEAEGLSGDEAAMAALNGTRMTWHA